jgi:hypothetical protein
MSVPLRNDSGAYRTAPLLSVVLATDAYDTIRPVLLALRQQRQAGRIEPVVVLPAAARDGIRRDELVGFAGTQIVVVDEVNPLAPARAAGVLAASAPIVFIGETHTYVQDGWADALLARFDGPWTAVVPAIDNANPHTPASCAAYLFDYARWGPRRSAGEISDPLVHNTAYRRPALLALGAALPTALDHRQEMMWPLLWAAGHRALFAPDARIVHMNVDRVRWLIEEKFCSGVAFGLRRAARWTWRRRLAYVLASPLIPIVLLGRVVRDARPASPMPMPARTVPALVLCAVAKTLGEVVSYLGIKLPASDRRVVDIEIHKAQYARHPWPRTVQQTAGPAGEAGRGRS